MEQLRVLQEIFSAMCSACSPFSNLCKLDIRKFCSRKRPLEKSDDDAPPPKLSDNEAEEPSTSQTKSDSLSKAAKKLVYKSRLCPFAICSSIMSSKIVV